MNKICFVVGHGKSKKGGYDSGATSGGYHEFKIAREIAKFAQNYYNSNYNETCDLMNYDGDIYLENRIKKINSNNYDFIAEFHLNAGGGNGTECYYFHSDNTGKKYADMICRNISSALDVPQRCNGTDDGGDKVRISNVTGKDYFAIIRSTKPTAVLIETVFIDNVSNLEKVITAEGQKACGEAIAKAVAEVRGLGVRPSAEHEQKEPMPTYQLTCKQINVREGINGKIAFVWYKGQLLNAHEFNGDWVRVDTANHWAKIKKYIKQV